MLAETVFTFSVLAFAAMALVLSLLDDKGRAASGEKTHDDFYCFFNPERFTLPRTGGRAAGR